MAGLIRRLRTLYFWVIKSEVRDRVSLLAIIKHLISPPCEKIAKAFVQHSCEDKDYFFYKIKGFDNLFNYPKELPYHNFAQAISEGLRPENWHYYEIPQTKVSRGDVIVDCGAAEGFFAFKYLNIAKKIYCIEPLPIFNRSLRKLFARQENVVIIQAALSDRIGKAYMYPAGFSSTCKDEQSDPVNDICVETLTIDSIFADKEVHIDYLKADLEGFEEKMILGALKTIKISKPRIAITTYHSGQNYKELIRLIQQQVPEYKWIVKGVEERCGNPVMLHMWVE